MITAYFDESGSHANQDGVPVLSLGCYISTAEQWEHFAKEWREILNEYKIACFHAVDYENPFCKDYENWDKGKKVWFYQRLQTVIKRRVKKGIAICIVLDDFTKVITGDYLKQLVSPYSFAARTCFEIIGEWSEKHNLQEPVACVFEAGSRKGGEVCDVFNRIKTHYNLGTLSFADKKDVVISKRGVTTERKGILHLQAADILAYEIRKLARTTIGCMRDDNQRLFMRRSMQNLLDYPHEALYFDEAALREIVSALESGGRIL